MSVRSSRTAKADLILQEASAWFIEFRTAEASAGDRGRFYEWLRRSPDHIQAYLEIAEGWAELPTADPEQQLDIQALIQRARESHDENVISLTPQALTSSELPRPRVRAWAAYVAVVALALGLGVWAYLSQANSYRTGVGEQRTVRLIDGSTIELNALSKIRVALSKDKREIELTEGQALFHVAKDANRPFIVHSDGTTVRAVGTQFDVYRKATGTTVTVLEGRVAVAEVVDMGSPGHPEVGAPSPVFLVAGEQVMVPAKHATADQPKPKRADVTVATAWVQKRLIFEATPLAEVAEEFNRYSARRLVIVDPELKSLGVSGVYSSSDPDSLLGFLRAQPNIALTETDKEIRVAKK